MSDEKEQLPKGGGDGGFWRSAFIDAKPLTAELLMEAAEHMLNAPQARPPIEYHHSACPKITTKGEKACRCGAAPLEAIFEDDLARSEP